ncbi:hypothetical protein M431DRAFT_536269 [Trichoderma harzianum CBS 226.95]|uniref:C2H2-type domain-containing protein n=1 Tax=Trichoderma harzianum CBS 226.95 TaxID=983964 RepID=A0A2T3ZRK9_TRIHA|nr:hypothetical protein M431DRAFT_536269 [Trichoderma harzianum CBS 226.95]PTB47443.1 hypothetical protein M431DRAFT_536269 [Trichoderma harzianum CBS 226.95]
MQFPEPVSYGYQRDCGSRLATSCLSTSFNSFSPQEVDTSAAHRSTPNALRIGFSSTYRSFRDSPSKATHTYTFSPMKAEHGRTSSTSTEGASSPFDIAEENERHYALQPHARHEQYYRTFHGFKLPLDPSPSYTEASLQLTPSIMKPTHNIPGLDMADNALSWLCGNDSPMPFLQSPQALEPLGLYQYSQTLMGRYYPHRSLVAPGEYSTERQMMVNEIRYKATGLHKEIRASRKVSEKNDNSYNLVQEARCKCDYPNCDKAFKRGEHLKRHKQTFHGEGPNRFSCEFCGKSQFNRQDSLNTHRKLHAQPKSGKRGVESIPAAIRVIEQEDRSRKRRLPPKSKFAAVSVTGREAKMQLMMATCHGPTHIGRHNGPTG